MDKHAKFNFKHFKFIKLHIFVGNLCNHYQLFK